MSRVFLLMLVAALLVALPVAADAPDLWFHVGDVVYPRGQQRHYRQGFFRPFAELLRPGESYAYQVLAKDERGEIVRMRRGLGIGGTRGEKTGRGSSNGPTPMGDGDGHESRKDRC